DLLSHAESSFELALLSGNTSDSIQQAGEQRDRQYAQVGAYVAGHCQILIALWDGVVTTAEGGTAEIVRFKLEGVPRAYTPLHSQRGILDPLDTGPVY